jgi:predicted secreted protein
MIRYISLLLFIGLAWGQVDTLWTKTFGESQHDLGRCLQQTSDGGFIIAGETNSFGNGGWDLWLIKTDADGNSEWEITYGSAGDTTISVGGGELVQQTSDGGYIFTCTKDWPAYTGSGEASSIWLVKINPNGDILWTKTISISDDDYAHAVLQTEDTGFILLASVNSSTMLIKTDSDGDTLWTNSYDGRGVDFVQASDFGYVITGSKYDGDELVWFLKTDEYGVQDTSITYNGGMTDEGNFIQETNDNGFVITGYTFDGMSVNMLKLIKTDSLGNQQWNRTFGTNDFSASGNSVLQTSDDEYIILGYTYSYGNGGKDIWMIKVDEDGGLKWDATFGGDNNESGESIQQTSEDEFVILGTTQSFGAGQNDIWLLKVKLNLTPDLELIEDQQISEDNSLTIQINATSYEGFSMSYFAVSDTSDVVVSFQNTNLTVTPVSNWFGSSVITVMVTDENDLSDTTDFTLTVIPVNDSPEDFNVLYPTVSDTFSTHVDSDTAIAFTWEESYDVDSDVTYKLSIGIWWFGQPFEDVHENITDTTISISANSLDLLINMTGQDTLLFTYIVESSDESYTIVSSNTGSFVLNRSFLDVDNKLYPKVFALHQNYPNPFNPVTTLQYDLPEDALVNITIYDLKGRIVNNLVSSQQNAGYKSVQWNATNNIGQPVSAGLYLYTIQAGDYTQTKKMVLLK